MNARRAALSRDLRTWDMLVAQPIRVVSGIDTTEGFSKNEQLDEEKLTIAAKLALLHRAFRETEFTSSDLHEKLSAPAQSDDETQLQDTFRRGPSSPGPKALGIELRKLENLYLPLGRGARILSAIAA